MTDVGTTARGNLSKRTKLQIFEREKGLCALCRCQVYPGRFIFEHMRALELGGEDDPSNIRLTCSACAKEKTRDDHARAAKAKRVKSRHLGLHQSAKPLPFGRNSRLKKRMDGTIVDRATGLPLTR